MRQSDLAKTAAVATTLVGKAERGEAVSPTTLRAIARVLEMPTEMVRAYVDEPPAENPEPMPADYPDEHEYMSAVYWYLRRMNMSHDAVMRGFQLAAAVYEHKRTDRDPPSTPGNKVG